MSAAGPLRWGLLSTARINDAILAGAAATPAARVTAVASRDRNRAESYAHAHDLERAHGSYEALLADPDVDAVYVSLPNGLHVPWAVRGLEAGKHVLCEKPLSADPAEVATAFDAAVRAGRILMEGFMYRHHPQTARMVELVRDGAVGVVSVIRASFGFRLDDPTDVRLSPELAGGALMDVGCYCVSAARLLTAAEPVQAYAVARLSDRGVDVRLSGTLRFEDGVVAQIDCFFDQAIRRSLEVFGTEGTLTAHDPWGGGRLELRRHGATEDIPAPVVDAYALELENVAAAARGDARPLLGRDDAVGQARTIAALYRSAASGQAVDVT